MHPRDGASKQAINGAKHFLEELLLLAWGQWMDDCKLA